MKVKENKSKVVLTRGQSWVELDGIFYPEELRSIADPIDKNCEGLEKKNGN